MAKNKKYLSVRSKVLLTIAASIVILFGFMYTVATQVLLKSYLSLEKDSVIQNLDRANDAINGAIDNQFLHLNDWSPWDELYQYAEDRNLEFEKGTLFAEGVIRQDQNGFFLADAKGSVFYAIHTDLENGIEVSSSTLVDYFEENTKLTTYTDTEAFTRGLVTLPSKGTAIFVSKPLLHNDNSGPIIGSVSILRYLDAKKIQEIADATHLVIEMFPFAGASLPVDVIEAKELLSKDSPYVVRPVSNTAVHGYRILYDVYGDPILVLRIETVRSIYNQGINTLSFFMIVGSIGLLIFAFFITGLLERLVIQRFVRLTREVEKVNVEKDLSIRVDVGKEDDMGKLAQKINQMLSWLSLARDAESASKKEIVTLLEDIKDGKEKAEEMVVQRTHELSDEKARLAASINSLSFGFIIADKEDNIIFRNPVLASILEIEKVPKKLQDIRDIFVGAEGTESFFDPIALAHQAMTDKKLIERKAVSFGKKFLRFLCAPIFAEDGSKDIVSTDVIGYAFIVEDITESKNMERSREEFFSIASHELRTPLTAIRWNTDMLLSMQGEEPKSKEMEEMLQDIHNSSIRLIGIVGDFLEVSRLEQGKIKITKETFDIYPVIEKTIHNLREMAEKKGLSITMLPAEAAIHTSVIGDSVRIEEVLDNLIGNAIKFTEKGTITIAVNPLGSFLKISIKDTGVGISAHNQSRLFKKFQQAGEDMLAREVNQSTGLGLYISKLIMEAMGGQIALEKSVLGEGSVFIFTLPRAS